MTTNRLEQLHDAGQSIWLDYIDRTMLRDGGLARMIRDDSITGQTSNPTIFDKALSEGHAYDDQLAAAPRGVSPAVLFEEIATDDVRAACDIFRPVFDAANGGDGFVSIEVSPGLAHDAAGTVREARRLWQTVDRPNVMIKVPGTVEGARAVRELTEEGVNVNITLLFAIQAYRRVIEAYLDGLDARVAKQQPIHQIASVASFFVSRVDTEVDKRIAARLATKPEADIAKRLSALQGKIAVANARLAYALFQQSFAGARWERLKEAGARLQRPLWASTSTKNPAYRDVMYVEELIGPHTVNTMPPQTIEAFRDHGVVARTVDRDVAGAEQQIGELELLGISLDDVTEKLLGDGIASFAKSMDQLFAGLTKKLRAMGREPAAAR